MLLTRSVAIKPPVGLSDDDPYKVVDGDGSHIVTVRHVELAPIIVEALNDIPVSYLTNTEEVLGD